MTNTEFINTVSYLTRNSDGASYWERVQKESKNVKVESVFDALSVMQVGYLVGRIKPKKKMCYANALITALAFHCEYVEGYVNIQGCPIEHAFCKKDGKYFDPTLEIVDLKLEVTNLEYTSIYERDSKEVLKIANEEGTYGPFSRKEYL